MIFFNFFTSIDHCTIILETNLTSDSIIRKVDRTNPYITSIPLYDTLEATEEEWISLNSYLSNIDWVYNMSGKNPNEALDYIIDTIEDGVKSCLRLKGASRITNSDGKSFVSKNHIPKMVCW